MRYAQIEHRLFCHITQNWRGRPLVSYEVVIDSIAATTTSKGLKVYARLDEHDYPKKIQVTDAELAAVNLKRGEFHPEWNYSIVPSPAPYEKGIKITDAQMKSINIQRDEFHGDWNYTIYPTATVIPS